MGDLISDALSNIMNAERVNKKEVVVKPASKLLREVIRIIKDKGYIESYEFVDDGKSGLIKIKLFNKINKMGSIRPRYPCTLDQIERFEKVYLPAADFGIIIISTPNGLMTHHEARTKKTGGILIAYCY